MSTTDETAQSIEFYKIKLMEKESQFTNLQAKMKKIQFKHARQVKQAKMQIDRSKDMLKQQKNKLDKISKTAAQHQQQNNLLQTRLTDLKQQKDREVQSIKAQYNKIKEQVRSYERILPTHTFLTEIGATISLLPTYEDIFMNLKERTDLHTQLQQKYDAYRHQMEQKLKTATKNVEYSRQKSAELQKQMKQILEKNLDLQSRLTQVKNADEELRMKLYELQQKQQQYKQKLAQTLEQNKQYQDRIREVVNAHHMQIQAKQQQIYKFTESEMVKHENEMRQTNARFQQRQNVLVQQINLLQQQCNAYRSKLQKQRQTIEESMEQYRQEILKTQLKYEQLQKEIQELHSSNLELKQRRDMMKALNQQLQAKSIAQLNEIAILKQELSHVQQYKDKKIKESQRKMLSISKSQEMLQLKIQELQEEKQQLYKEKVEKESQNIALINQLEDAKARVDGYSPNRLNVDKIPKELQLQMRKGSIDMKSQKSQNRRLSYHFASFASSYNDERHEQMYIQNYDEGQLQENNKIIQQLQKRIISFEGELTHEIQKNEELKSKLQMQQNLINKQQLQLKECLSEINSIKLQNSKILTEREQLFQKIKKIEIQQETLSVQISQKTASIKELQKQLKNKQIVIQEKIQQQQMLQKKLSIIKNSEENIKIANNKLMEQLKKENENKNEMQKYLKELKNQKQAQKNEINQLQLSLENSNKDKDQFQSMKKQFIEKEKNYLKEINQKDKKIQQIQSQKKQIEKKLQNKEEVILKKEQSIEEMQNEISKYKQQLHQNKQKIQFQSRQLQMMTETLSRERKDRTIRQVPSLQNLNDGIDQEEQFNKTYNLASQKEGKIYLLQRQIEDLKQQIEEIKQKNEIKIQGMDEQLNQYIQQIIKMKVKCAQAEMKAAEKQHLYHKMKKKMQQAIYNAQSYPTVKTQ